VTLAQRTTHEWTLWVVAVSCAAHATEEYFTGWQQWARQALGIAMPTEVFVVMNVILTIIAGAVTGIVMAFGVVLAARRLGGEERRLTGRVYVEVSLLEHHRPHHAYVR
jgi:hypothetical protein